MNKAIIVFFFFFQAEDGIRDKLVTGVQTCALPIWPRLWSAPPAAASPWPWRPSSGSTRGSRALRSGSKTAPCDARTFGRGVPLLCGVSSVYPAKRFQASIFDLRLLRRSVARPAFQLHAQRQAHLRKDLLDLLQRLAAEVLGLQHLGLGLLDQLPDVADVGVLQAVRRTDRQLQLVDRLPQ